VVRPASLILVAALALASGAARGAEPACRVEVSLEPARAVAGQQVRHRVRVLRSDRVRQVDWAIPPSFASARAEVLPPQPGADVRVDGRVFHVYDDLRAIIPERPGRFEYRGAELRCQLAGGEVQQIPLPAATLEVLPLPEAGRPPDFTGLVGPLLLQLVVTPERVALGASLRVAVMARGTGNLWLLDAPFGPEAFGDAEVFARQPELVLERGRELYVRQHFAFDVVPRRTGRLRVPSLKVPYFDPDSGAYRVAETQEVEVQVEERAAASPAAKAELRGEGAAAGLERRGGGHGLPLLAGGLAAGAAVAVWGWRRRRGLGAAAEALHAAARARAAGDTSEERGALARALRAALARDVPEAPALAVEELAAQPGLSAPARAAVELLASLERARFDRAAPAPGAEEVARALRALGVRPARRAPRARAALLLLSAALAGGAFQSGCASAGRGRDEPMTPARLEAWLREETSDLEVLDGQLRFLYGGVRMVCLRDLHADRMRVVAAVTEESALTVASARILLQANFGNTLDARYAIREGMLYAVYLHPLSSLTLRDLEAALGQVANLVRTFGTSYSATGAKR
jgi:hypothetical protein